MKPASGQKRFKLETKYPHLRSDGMTARQNGGTRALDISCPCVLAMQQDPECPWHGRKEDDGDHREHPAG